MSFAAPLSPIAAQYRLSRWWVALIWVAVIAAVVAGFLYFSGRWQIFGHKEQTASAPVVAAPPPSTSLIRPPAETVVVRTPGPTAQQQQQLPIDAERQKALASDIQGFKGGGSTNQAAKPASVADTEKPGGPQDPLEASLQPTRVDGTEVVELPNPRWSIAHGRILPCIQQSRARSALPGMITATIPEAVYGDTADSILIPAGASVFGTIQHGLVNGIDYMAVLWQDVTTPVLYDSKGLAHRFRIAVNSPATSELGETGLDGDVNHHYVKKIGGILGMSLIQGAIQAGIQSVSKSQGNNNLNFNSFQSGGDSAAETLLKSWVAIPDVMTRDQGLTCGIGVIRDLNLHNAYTLLRNYRS